jgi:hypothetical protein
MTITTAQAKTSNLPGDSSTFTFDFSPLVIYDADDIDVYLTVTATGAQTLLTRGSGASNYSVNVTTYPGTGTITYPADEGTPLASTSTVTIKKKLSKLQGLDLGNQIDYDPDAVEENFDKIVAMVIDLQEQVDRCIKVPLNYPTLTETDLTDFTSSDGSKYVQLSSDGTTFQLNTIASTTGSAGDAVPLEADETAAAAGSSANYARDDHRHAVSSNIPKKDAENVFTESMVWKKGSDVASAATLALGAGNWFDITGTTAITSITSIGVGTFVILQFDGALTLTHHATDLVCPGGEDIITVAGDIVGLYEYAASDWRVCFVQNNVPNDRTKIGDLGAKVTFHDDFIGTISTPISSTAGSGTGNAAATISAGAGGRVTLTSASDDGAHSANCSTLTLDTLDWRADQGGLILETRLQIDDVSEAVLFVGFTDTISTTVELPIYMNAGNIDSDAANACGMIYDVDATTDRWTQGGVKANTDTSPTVHGSGAPADATWVTIRVEVSSAGAVECFFDGTSVGTAVANAVTTTTPLTPAIIIGNRSANQVVATIDYLWVQANR